MKQPSIGFFRNGAQVLTIGYYRMVYQKLKKFMSCCINKFHKFNTVGESENPCIHILNFVLPAEFYNFTNVLSITVFLVFITV